MEFIPTDLVTSEAASLGACTACDLAMNFMSMSLEYGMAVEHLQRMLEKACTLSDEFDEEQCSMLLSKFMVRHSYLVVFYMF